MYTLFAAIVLSAACLNPTFVGVHKIYAYAPQLGGINGGGKMASGMVPSLDMDGLFVACDRRYAFGTRFKIDGYNEIVTCADRGGAIKGRVLDLLIVSRTATDAKQRAKEWGIRHRGVWVCHD